MLLSSVLGRNATVFTVSMETHTIGILTETAFAFGAKQVQMITTGPQWKKGLFDTFPNKPEEL